MKPELERTPMPDVTEEEIKPCPMCDHAPIAVQIPQLSSPRYRCNNSQCPMSGYFTLQEWNHRPEEDRLRKSSHSVSQCCPMSERLERENAELRAIVEKLPKTADGKILFPGQYICRRSGFTDYVFEGIVEDWLWQETFDDTGLSNSGEWWVRTAKPRHWAHPFHDCYSTRAAAEASAKGVK